MARPIRTVRVPRDASLPAANLTAPQATALIGGVNRLETLELDARRYLAVHADVDDAIDAMLADIPGASGGAAGVTLTFPYRPDGYAIAREHVITKPGVRLASPSAFGAIFYAQPGLTGAMFRFKDAGYVMRGPQIENVVIMMGTSSADAIVIHGAYDQASLRNVFIEGLNGSASGISIVPNMSNPNPDLQLSQTILAENCWVHGSGTGFTGNAWRLDRVQEATFIGCKGLGRSSTAGTAWRIDNSRSLAFYNCSAANADIGWHITSTVRETTAILLDQPLFEDVGEAIVATGNATYRVQRLAMTNPRVETGAGPSTLAYVTVADLDTGNLAFTVAATSTQIILRTRDMGQVTNNGTDSATIEAPNAVNNFLTFSPKVEVRGPGAALRWSVPGRTGRFEAFWNASSGANFGWVFRGNTGTADIDLHTVAPSLEAQSWHLLAGGASRETMRLENPSAADQAGMLLLVNIGGAVSVRRVEIGAANSGGTGYRVLRVTN